MVKLSKAAFKAGLKSTGSAAMTGASAVGRVVKKNPKLTLLGAGAAGTGIYAGVSGKSYKEAVGDVTEAGTKLAAGAAKEAAEIGGEIAGEVASGAFSGLADATGLPVDTIKKVAMAITAIFVLGIMYRFYRMFAG